MFEATWQVFVLCIVIGLFLAWVMTLKKQIIVLMEDNAKLKKMIRDKVAQETAGTKITEDQPSWGHKPH